MNRRRDLLHTNKQAEFVAWALTEGYESQPVKSIFESFRLVKPGKGELLIGHKRDRSDHVTTTGRLTALVTRWQKSAKTSATLPAVV